MKSPFPPVIQALPEFGAHFEGRVIKASNCDIIFSTYPAGTDIPEHDHETENHSIVTTGELILVVEGSEKRFGPGQWCSVPARARHSARTEKDTALIEFWFK